MFSKLTVFQTAKAMAVHAGARQSLIAQNVANADTPGYRSRDLPAFTTAVQPARNFASTMRGSRAGHTMPDAPVHVAQLRPVSEENADPNRNGVSLEEEMVRSVEAQRDHERALAIYRSALRVLRTSLGGN